MSVEWQLYAWLVSVLGGVGVGMLFDVHQVVVARAPRRRGRRGVRPTWFDFGFGLVTSFVALASIVLANWGQPRFYVFLGLLAGFAGYQWLAAPVMRAAFSTGLRFGGRAMGQALGAAGWPMRLVRPVARPMARSAHRGLRQAGRWLRQARPLGRKAEPPGPETPPNPPAVT